MRTRITRLVGPVAERDDLVQKVFIAFHRGLPAYRGEAKLSTYLHRIAVNTAYDHLRGRHRAAESEGPLDAEALVEQLGPALEDQVAARADLARLLALLDQLSPKKRIAFVLVAVEGCSLAEAAALIGAPGRHGQAAGAARAPRSAGAPGGGDRDARGATGGGDVVIGRRDPEAGAAESEELEQALRPSSGASRRRSTRLRGRAPRRAWAPSSRASPDGATGARWGGAAALLAVGAAAGVRADRTHRRDRRAGSRVAGGPEPSLRFEPYVVAPTARRARQRRRPCRRPWSNRPRASTSRRGGWCARRWATPSRSR